MYQLTGLYLITGMINDDTTPNTRRCLDVFYLHLLALNIKDFWLYLGISLICLKYKSNREMMTEGHKQLLTYIFMKLMRTVTASR